jgi:hypothetical protein
LLTKRYGFAGGPDHAILDTLFFTSAALAKPKPPVNPQPIPANALVVYSNVDGLALRTQPSVIEQTLIERVALAAKLIVLEDPIAAKGKIGSFNSWLAVQVDADSQQGFVAAWYVDSAVQDVPPVQPDPPFSPPNGPAAPPAQSLVIYAAADGLAFRTQPQVSDATLIRRVPLNTQFSVLDPVDQARAQIGVTGQWLKVQDVQGTTGYVAAWNISSEAQKAPLGAAPAPVTPLPPPAPPTGNLSVRTTAEGVALRSQPVISPITVIKRLPIGSELVALDGQVGADSKIGQVNQWINVSDISGDKGYVAAWFVVKTPRPDATATVS